MEPPKCCGVERSISVNVCARACVCVRSHLHFLEMSFQFTYGGSSGILRGYGIRLPAVIRKRYNWWLHGNAVKDQRESLMARESSLGEEI